MKNTKEIKTTTFKKVVEESGLMQFVSIAARESELKDNQYFALMVIDSDYPRNGSPYVKGIDTLKHDALVGVEKTTHKNPNEGVYISKYYDKRARYYRGKCIIVEIKEENKSKFCEL